MEEISAFFNYLMNSEEIIQTGGLLAILLIVYVENGLFFGFFLPGDYLLFLTGVFVASQHLEQPILLVLFGVFAAAVLGSYTGYISGRFFGDKIRNKKDSLFFKQKYLERTSRYFEKYGNRTLIIARFLPIVRTFAPILAGLVRMNFIQFTIYNLIGGAIWTLTLVGGGYLLGNKFPFIIDYVHYIILFFLAITTFTVIKGYLNAKKEFKD
ncbi:DedA family protein [Leadbetterella byssophila]|jgi:membrane-associated protein|uniref:SNARE associated Golgi protein-like protein n=1 Tax=Leadbetterella byssophila (strain DSM 17132 / JCM 16389 / KACC 11308 / NBRC 106382 / 4M15) TaxID=649349 RepID=E4RRU7_LEAB4|nr:DedA family protein [Leadbetterella byssophila]ADQ17634.1 SNARE associated Golgi protein-like protein [Leadbetterella byssophila DSM 17132]